MRVPERYRVTTGPMATSSEYGRNGCFLVPSPEPGWLLEIIASDGSDSEVPEADGWEHVSAKATSLNRRKLRTPSWKEMAFLKDVFWDDSDVVMQLHPAKSNYVNNHPNVLHLWRSRTQPIPLPQLICV